MERELAANNQELAATAKGFDEAGSEAGDFGEVSTMPPMKPIILAKLWILPVNR